uniref:O-GlcNAcase like n=1 Tax=Oryzias latipes TaxID=8090 RepID=A0A3P9ITG2_ORYLA
MFAGKKVTVPLLNAGFYGRPWTMEQRTELFKREQQWGLNTYLYAPKDDYKHRMYWRELYSPEEADQLKALISAAKQHQVEFIYAISPGLDITFSNPKEVAALKRKLDQVKQFGCSSFSLLFDDIEAEMCAADKKAFSSFADAQVSITNQVYEHLRSPETFLFCPTDYCAAFCTPTVSQSSYLQTVGVKLLPGIDILWTGTWCPTKSLWRGAVILTGVLLTNPNCEFYPNFVAIHTLATWCGSADGGAPDVEMDGQDCGYCPTKALNLALSDWLLELMSADGAAGQLKKDSSKEEWMQTDSGESPYVPGPEENPLYTAEPLTLDDLKLLSDLFYLPYEHGPTARSMLQELDWLKTHSQTEQEWRCRAQHFDQMCKAVVQMFNRLSNAPNRRILYDLYNYICDIKSGVGLACAHVKALGGQDSPAAQLMTDDPEPWGFRGGLSGELQVGDLFRHPPMTAVYTVRPYSAEDQVRILTASLPGSVLIRVHMRTLSSGEVPPSPGNAFVMEDDVGVCGYAFALIDARPAAAKFQVITDFPSLLGLQVLPRVTDPSPARRMMALLLSSLRSSGSRGAFCELRASDRRMIDFFSKLGSFKHMSGVDLPQDVLVLAAGL